MTGENYPQNTESDVYWYSIQGNYILYFLHLTLVTPSMGAVLKDIVSRLQYACIMIALGSLFVYIVTLY